MRARGFSTDLLRTAALLSRVQGVVVAAPLLQALQTPRGMAIVAGLAGLPAARFDGPSVPMDAAFACERCGAVNGCDCPVSPPVDASDDDLRHLELSRGIRS